MSFGLLNRWRDRQKQGEVTARVAALETLGWFRFLAPEAVPEARKAVAESNHPLLEVTGRVFSADAEELAEGRALGLIAMIVPLLRGEGVAVELETRPQKKARGIENEPDWLPTVEKLRVTRKSGGPLVDVSLSSREPDYVLKVGSEAIVLCGAEEASDAWDLVPERLFRFLSELLAAHGSKERAFRQDGGNDLNLVIATEEQRQFLTTWLTGHDLLK